MSQTIETLKQLGYSIKVDRYGYRVELNDEFVGAAGTKTNREMHWRHARANITDYTKQAWITAEQHSQLTDLTETLNKD